MQARVQEREIDFIALNEELERRVRARTAELRLAERVILNTIEGVIVTDAGGRIVSVNPAFSDITGYAAEEVIGRNPNLLSSHRHPPEFFCTMWEDLSRNGFWRGEVWNRRKSGELFLENLTISRIPGDDDFPTHFVGVFQDITELRSKDARIRHLAYHDPLTGLANRMLLQDRLKHALSLAQRNRRMVGLMFIDLDRFKSINDSLGHDVGDSLLQEVASRISRCVRISDTVARPGGDEFLVITDEIPRADACAVVAQKIIAALSQPMEICGHAIQIGCSVGIAVYPEDAATSVDLMKHADAAMYAAKGAGGGVFRYFQAEMTERNLQRLTLEMDLRRAISNGEMELHYQPKLDLRTHALVGLEALVRWRCPDRGLVLPGEFIPVAEETGVIIELGDWVLEEACRQIAGWQAQGILPAPVAVNVSSRQFQKVNLADRVREATDRHRIDPALLELELTESTVMTNILQTIEVFQALRGIGVSIAVDDFGTGYSSLTYLRRLPVNVIKIDRSFVVGLGSSDEDAEIIRTIIALARALGLTVVAEGVETTGQAEVLRTLECDLAQGFLFSRALPAHQITGWLRGRGPAPPAGSAA
jgi:diguanylate cyclase (GGDEF)-like protein/PAS domain S-box-containing protein